MRAGPRPGTVPFEVLVIGGGIHGASVARDAAGRGLSVFLAEQSDLAGGTSSRSSKLIHGGIRYLETGQWGLVRAALHERAVLLRTAPHLVRPLPFLLPFYKGGGRPAWKVKLGLSIYDLLAGNTGLPGHRMLSDVEAASLEPGLSREGLESAALFHDAQMDDARLVVANTVAAVRSGAVVRTRMAVTKLAATGTGSARVWRVALEARPAGGSAAGGPPPVTETIEARSVVNASGVWADHVRSLASSARSPEVRGTRGTHVVVPALTKERALLLFAGQDGRVLFVLPWGDYSLVGTTDTDHAGSPDAVAPTPQDLRYLWQEIMRRWPDRFRDPATQTTRAFAGMRSLVRGGTALPWQNTREARVIEEEGMFSLVGGKYTTARGLAERVVNQVASYLRRGTGPCSTARTMLPGGEERTRTIAVRARAAPESVAGVHRAEVEYAVQQEFAREVSDFVWRRSNLWLDRRAALEAAPHIAYWMAGPLGWNAEQCDASLERLRAECEAEDRVIALTAMAGIPEEGP